MVEVWRMSCGRKNYAIAFCAESVEFHTCVKSILWQELSPSSALEGWLIKFWQRTDPATPTRRCCLRASGMCMIRIGRSQWSSRLRQVSASARLPRLTRRSYSTAPIFLNGATTRAANRNGLSKANTWNVCRKADIYTKEKFWRLVTHCTCL